MIRDSTHMLDAAQISDPAVRRSMIDTSLVGLGFDPLTDDEAAELFEE